MPKRTSLLRLVSCALIASTVALNPFLSLPAYAADPPSGVVIGEIAWAGSTLSTADEWIELWNLEDTTATIGGWSLADAAAGSWTILLPVDAAIPPHATYLIANYAASDTKSSLNVPPDVVTTTISLSNSQLQIKLMDASGFTVDTAGSGAVPPAGSSLPVKTSMVRNDISWMNATTTSGLKPGLTDLATPGLCDGCRADTEPVASGQLPVAIDDPMTPTSTEQAVDSTTTAEELTDASSTSVDVSSTTPADEPITDTTATDTIDTAATSTDLPLSSTATIEPADTPSPPKPAYGLLRLNEVSPAPATGQKEWIEIVTLDAMQSIDVNGCTLHDAQGTILKLAHTVIDPAGSRYAVFTLSSSKLNNSGDTVSLYDPDGRLIDTIRFGKTKTGDALIRFPDLVGDWRETTVASPGAMNALPPPLPAPVPQTNAQAPATTPAASVKKAASPAVNPAPKEQPAPTFEDLPPEDEIPLAAPLETETVSARPKASSAKKSTAKKYSPALTLESFDMLTSDELSGLRVKLFGTVGTPLGILTSHSFILHAPDGRGIRVSVPTSRRLPAYRANIAVIGTLHLTDQGAVLAMTASDPWTVLPTTTLGVMPRDADLLTPAEEDAWSLVETTGTVSAVKGTTVTLELEDTDVIVRIRPAMHYRTKRLAVGDVIRVTGVLDATKDAPEILPRSPEDIEIVSHASPASKGTAQGAGQPLSGWTPIGAAGGAIAVTEGAKHLHRRRKQKQLEKKLEDLVTTTQ